MQNTTLVPGADGPGYPDEPMSSCLKDIMHPTPPLLLQPENAETAGETREKAP